MVVGIQGRIRPVPGLEWDRARVSPPAARVVALQAPGHLPGTRPDAGPTLIDWNTCIDWNT